MSAGARVGWDAVRRHDESLASDETMDDGFRT
jgi:hypothetical protein